MELRKDYILDRWVIINPKRGLRPNQFVPQNRKETKKEIKNCFFCPGNESMTPPEIGRNGKKWTMRWFPNKFSAVGAEGNALIRTDNTYFTFADAKGYHEVIVETNNHKKQIFDLSEKQLIELFKVYQSRIKELREKENIAHVSLFKNHGPDAGTSIIHSHTQVIAYNELPKEIREKSDASKKYGHCPYCDIVGIEKNSFRKCFENEKFAAFTPYASRFNYEIWLFPKEHITDFCSMDEIYLSQFAEIFSKIVKKLKNVSFNYFINNYDFHFFVEFCPRISKFAGFELSTGTIINTVSPEDAAAFYRGEKK